MSNVFDVPVEERTLQSYIDEARGMIARWGPRWMTINDDVIANVATAIAKAEYNFDPSRGNKRVTVRITYGRYQIIKELRDIKRLSKRPKHFSIHAERSQKNHYNASGKYTRGDSEIEDYREPAYTQDELKEEVEDKKALVRRIIRENKTMTEKQKKYIRMKYINGMSEKEMAKEIGCSKQAVNQIVLAGVRKLKQELL